MKVWLSAVLFGYCLAAGADETIVVCYNYGCLSQADIVYSERQLAAIDRLLELAGSAASERALLAWAIAQLYAWAGEQSPVKNDRGGNYLDDGVNGRMDCIDHSTSTTRLLQMIERRGGLRWHRVLEAQRRVRGLLFQHYSAAIEERSPTAGGEPGRFVVDSWYVDNGQPAVIMPLESWLRGDDSDVE